MSTADYAAGKSLSARPTRSVLSLDKLVATAFEPEDALTALRRYCGG